MPRLISVRLAAACALLLALSLTIVAGAAAKGFSAELRVVGSGGKVLTEQTVPTKTTAVKTSPKANCFGPGSGGSGKSVSIPGNTALGLLARAETFPKSSLSPLSISDSFDFGLALCGVGSSVAKGDESWFLKVNHKSLEVSGDAAKIKAGDDVLWALVSYPYPDELALVAPSKAIAGKPFTVTAYTYDDKGKRKPAAGVKVGGASGLTSSAGKATVTLTKPKLLQATKGDLIPARAGVCIGPVCPAGS